MDVNDVNVEEKRVSSKNLLFSEIHVIHPLIRPLIRDLERFLSAFQEFGLEPPSYHETTRYCSVRIFFCIKFHRPIRPCLFRTSFNQHVLKSNFKCLVCPVVHCKLQCFYGYKEDEQGCKKCECREQSGE